MTSSCSEKTYCNGIFIDGAVGRWWLQKIYLIYTKSQNECVKKYFTPFECVEEDFHTSILHLSKGVIFLGQGEMQSAAGVLCSYMMSADNDIWLRRCMQM